MAKKYFYTLPFYLFIFFSFGCQSIRSGAMGRNKQGMLSWFTQNNKKISRSDKKEVAWKNNIYNGELGKLLNPLLSDIPSDLIKLIIEMVDSENHYLDGYTRLLIKSLLPSYHLENWNNRKLTPELLLELAKVRDIEKIADRAITELRYINSNKKWYEFFSNTKDFREYTKAIITSKQLKNKTWLREKLLTLIFLLEQTKFKHTYCLNKIFDNNSWDSLPLKEVRAQLAHLLQIVGRLKDNWIGEETEGIVDGLKSFWPKAMGILYCENCEKARTAARLDRGKWLDIMLSLTNKRTLYELANQTSYLEEKKNNIWQSVINPDKRLNNLYFINQINMDSLNIHNYRLHISLFNSMREGLKSPKKGIHGVELIDQVLAAIFLKSEIDLPDHHSEQLEKEIELWHERLEIKEKRKKLRRALLALNLLSQTCAGLNLICSSDKLSMRAIVPLNAFTWFLPYLMYKHNSEHPSWLMEKMLLLFPIIMTIVAFGLVYIVPNPS